MNPDYLIVGHLSLDQTESGTRIGGTAAYSARAARLMGRNVAVVTSAPDDLASFPELADIEFLNIESKSWTSFENRYLDGTGRVQNWISTAEPIDVDNVPISWQLAPIVHLAPIAQELSTDFALGCPSDLCCATIQGWLRGRSSSSKVLVEVNAGLDRALKYLGAAVVSEQDVMADQRLIDELAESARLLIVTRAELGCDVYQEEGRKRIPVEKVEVADPTGAGDIFAAAFFVAYSESSDAVQSARFANDFTAWILQDISRLDGPAGEFEPEIIATNDAE